MEITPVAVLYAKGPVALKAARDLSSVKYKRLPSLTSLDVNVTYPVRPATLATGAAWGADHDRAPLPFVIK